MAFSVRPQVSVVGGNPFDLHARTLDQLLYGTPTRGFKLRMIFYLGLVVLYVHRGFMR